MENTKIAFSNKVNITLNQTEGCLSFYWIMPKVNEATNEVTDEIVETVRVTMSIDGLKNLSSALNSLVEQINNDGKQN